MTLWKAELQLRQARWAMAAAARWRTLATVRAPLVQWSTAAALGLVLGLLASALLGLMNSPIVDWWVRRLVDRHVGARIIRALPLPDWTNEARSHVAAEVAALLAAKGQSEIAGSRTRRLRAASDPLGSLVAIDVAVARGFGLGREDVERMLDDFPGTARGVPEERRRALSDALRADRRERAVEERNGG